MTIHVYYEHRCGACGAFYIPFAPGVACPKCGRIEGEVFDFAAQAASSLRFNLQAYGKYLPPAWYVGSLGDHCLRLLFRIFEGFRTRADPSVEFPAFLDRELAVMDWGEQPYFEKHVRDLALKVRSVLEEADYDA